MGGLQVKTGTGVSCTEVTEIREVLSKVSADVITGIETVL